MAIDFIPAKGSTWFTRLFSRWQWSKDPIASQWYRQLFIQFTGKDTVTIEVDRDDIRTAYNDCPPLQAVIDRGARMFANGEWKCVDANDPEKEFPDDEGLRLLKNPNPEQRNGEKFLMSYWINKMLFANIFIRKIQGSTLALPKVLRVLPSDIMEIELTKRFYDQVDLSAMFKGYAMNVGNDKVKYDIRDIIYDADNFSFEEGRGISKVPNLTFPINNIIAAYKTRNILTVNKGLLGFISPEAKDGIGTILPFQLKEKEAVEKDFEEKSNLYSGNPKVKIASQPVRWNQMGSNTRELMLFEEVEEDWIAICAAFDMPKELFLKDATFENKREAKKSAYQDAIIPVADGLGTLMTNELGADQRGRKYILNYDWLPVFQEDEEKTQRAERIKVERLSRLQEDGIINAEAYAQLAGVELSGDGVRQPRNNISLNQPQ